MSTFSFSNCMCEWALNIIKIAEQRKLALDKKPQMVVSNKYGPIAKGTHYHPSKMMKC
jgi:hypothetical protein